MAYSNDGEIWKFVDNGAIFQANTDQKTKVAVTFRRLVFARTIRIYPVAICGGLCMRFAAYFADLI